MLPYLLNAIYFSLLLYSAFVAYSQWRLSGDKAILWYIGFLLAAICNQLPDFGRDLQLCGINNPLPNLPIRWDVPMQYLAEVCYLCFIYIILDVKHNAPRVAPSFQVLAGLYGLLFGVNVVLQMTVDYAIWIEVHQISRLVLLPFLMALVVVMAPKVRFFYQKLVLTGTVALLLGGVGVLLRHWNGQVESPIPDFVYCFFTPLGKICLYDVKVGILLDIGCFTWALSLRQKALLQGMVQLRPGDLVATPPNREMLLDGLAPGAAAQDEFMKDLDAVLLKIHADENMGVQEVARELHKTPGQVNRKIKSKTGFTTEQYLLRYRLQKSCELLATENIPISQIVSMVGLNDLAHYSKSFKKRYGCSPAEMRKTLRKNAG